MQLTLAMGLKYEPSGYSLLPENLSQQESGSVRLQNSEAVIDVEAREVHSATVVAPNTPRRFEYLFYDLHAGLVLLPEIGSKLDTVI